MSQSFRSVSSRVLLPIATAALAVCTGASVNAATLETFAYPNNVSFFGVSSNAGIVASYNGSGSFYYDAARNATVISPLTPIDGSGLAPVVSANGASIAASITGANGYSQAGVYSTATHSWTTLGTANGSSGYYLQTGANGISADGHVVVGYANYAATADGQGGRYHAAVWRDGQFYDLSGASATTHGRIVSASADGSIVAGYTDNNRVTSSRVWTWNGSGYTAAFAPTGVNSYDGTTNAVPVDMLSANGVWGAGRSIIAMGSPNYGSFGNAITFNPATLWNSQTNTTTVIPFDHVINYNDVDSMYYDLNKNMVASIAGVLNDGTVFGTFGTCPDNRCGADRTTADTWVYSASTGQSITFDSYLAAHGITLSATQHVASIDGVSADGSAITGLVFDSSTASMSSFIVSNISAVPEPGQWLLMALGLPLLMARRLRNRRAD